MKAQCRNLNRQRSLDGSAAAEVLGMDGSDPSPSQGVVAQETWESLLQGLPESSATILKMLREGHSHRDIARALSVSEKTVYRLIRTLKLRRAS